LNVAGLLAASLVLGLGMDAARGECGANELVKLTADDAAGYDKFGVSVSLDGDTVVIGAFGDENETGAAYVFLREGASWNQQAKLVADDGDLTDYFGWSVAIDGDTIVVGSRFDDDMGGNAGAAYVFVRSGASWSQQAKLLARDGEATDLFGTSVAIDGDTIVVGAIGDDDMADRAGAACVFTRSGTEWSHQAKLLPSDAGVWDEFGTSVSIDGDTIAVGCIGDDDMGDNAGAVYIYERSGSTWSQQVKLIANDGATSDNFGTAVALKGGTLVAGAPGDDDMGPTSGSAYVFVGSGASWSQQAKLVASDGSDNAQLGESVSVVGDMIVVGAANETNQGGNAAGSAYVFVRSGQSWSQAAKLLASDGGFVESLGCSASISGDTAIVGARNDDGVDENSGAAYVFGSLFDCNGNVTLDICDITEGTSQDANGNGVPDECDCPGDLDGDWDIDLSDLARLLSNYGMTGGASYADGDIDFDSDVDLADLAALLSIYGTTCP